MTSPFPQDLERRLSNQIEAYRQETLLRSQNPEITRQDIDRAQALWVEANKGQRPEIVDLLS